MKKIIITILTILLIQASSFTLASSDYVVRDIQLEGARRITLATLLTYMPLAVGDRLTERSAQRVIKALYEAGFFKDIKLFRKGDTLIVRVKERPAIAEINYEGNKKIKSEDIDESFSDLGLVAGRVYNDEVLDKIKRELERLYFSHGKYGIKLLTKVTPLPRNRVKIDIDIKEGRSAIIRSINIIGNKNISDEEILDELELGIPAWYQLFSQKDQYSTSKLSDDIEAVESKYLDNGYIAYELESTQVTISPDKKDIYITISVNEGERYKIGKVEVIGSVGDYAKLFTNVATRLNAEGEYFSNARIESTKEYIETVLSYRGYAFAETEVLQTNRDDENLTVDLRLVVNRGKRVYVRNIEFFGNEKSQDEVYRREMRQLEGAIYLKESAERSKTRIERLVYVEEAELEAPPVEGSDDQVDIAINIKERLSGTFNAGIGYADVSGTVFNVSVSQSNLFGTGNSLTLSTARSDLFENLNFAYTNPYVDNYGTSRTIQLNYSQYDTSTTFSTPYVTNNRGMSVTYQVPLSEYTGFQYGIGFSDLELAVQNVAQLSAIPLEISSFLIDPGEQHDLVPITLGYYYDTRNRGLFPDKGKRQSVSIEYYSPLGDLTYYKFNYSGKYYWPMSDNFTFHIDTRVGYGEGSDELDSLPFYEKYIAGGIGNLRGFRSRTIGPRATYPLLRLPNGDLVPQQIRPDVLGGDMMLLGSTEIIWSPPFGNNSMRLSWFFDFGNIFATEDEFDASELKSSTGFALNWLAPVGAMTFSYAEPIYRGEGTNIFNADHDFRNNGQEIERFQFTVGNSF